MEGHCSTGQSPQWAVVPMEEKLTRVRPTSITSNYTLTYCLPKFSNQLEELLLDHPL